MNLLFLDIIYLSIKKWFTWESNPARRAYKTRSLNQRDREPLINQWELLESDQFNQPYEGWKMPYLPAPNISYLLRIRT